MLLANVSIVVVPAAGGGGGCTRGLWPASYTEYAIDGIGI